MQVRWRRAHEMARLHAAPETLSSLAAGRCFKPPKDWNSKYAPYLVSAMAGKQWTQARVAATRHPGWTTDNRCQLCKAEHGTLSHRHVCPRVIEVVGQEQKPEAVRRLETGMDPAKLTLWRTRGIGATRIGLIRARNEEMLVWHKKMRQHVDETRLTWYIDASMMDGDEPTTQAFGYALVAVGPSGRLEAAASGRRPPTSRLSARPKHALSESS